MTQRDVIPSLEELASEIVREAKLPALQVAVAKDGEVVWSGAWGGRVSQPGTRAANDALVFHTYSAGKPVLALALGCALERQHLTWDTPVTQLLPFLKGEGMEAVSLAHLASHHAGLANAPLPLAEAGTAAGRIARLATWSPRHAPGARFAYHAESAWWLLAAALEALEGVSPVSAVGALLRAIGLGERAGLIPSSSWASDIVPPELIGEHGAYLPQDPKSVAYRNAYDAHLLQLAQPEFRTLGVPGSGYLSTACELALFYQQLLRGLKGTHSALSRECVEGLLQVDHPQSLDPSTGAEAMRGRGLVLAGDAQRYLRGFPPGLSERGFGHTGAGGQFAWADPETGVSFALLSSGLERSPLQMGVRGARFGSAALEALSS